MKLYHYWRSSSSWRVRFALEYKKIPCELIQVNLLNGESESPAHLLRHPKGLVPVLELDSGNTIIESLAIIDYLENAFPQSPSVYPKDPLERAHSIALAEVINSGIHPLQNPPVVSFLSEHYGISQDQQKKWIQHWIRNGLELFELKLRDSLIQDSKGFAIAATPTLADLCLMPQLYNAKRYEVIYEDLPKIITLESRLIHLESYRNSHPDRYQPT